MRPLFSLKKLALSFLVLPALLGLSSCEHPDGGGDGFTPSAALEEAFKKDFPSATEVAWVRYDVYAVASFIVPAKAAETKMTAWYTNDAAPQLVQQQQNMPGLESLPEAVRNAFYASAYNKSDTWRVDEVEVHRRHYAADQIIYKIELDALQAGKPDVDLFYDQDGVLLKEELDYDDDNGRDWDDDDMPISPDAYQSCLDFLNSRYPDYRVDDLERMDTRQHGTLFKAELEKRTGPEEEELDVFLSSDVQFLASSIEIPYRDLPQAVRTAAEQKYPAPAWEIEDEAKEWETNENKLLYSIEAEQEERGMETEVTAFFQEDGTLFNEYKKFD